MAVNISRKTQVEAAVEAVAGYVPVGNSLIDFSNWAVGTMPPSGYASYGDAGENAMVQDEGPFGSFRAIWSSPGNDAASDSDGGWHTANFTIDPTKLYRFSVWVKRPVVGNGKFTLGFHGMDSNGSNVGAISNVGSGGTADTNPYFDASFWTDDGLSTGTPLEANKWFLVVGHVFPYDNTDYGLHADSGWYEAYSATEVRENINWQLVSGISYDYRWVDANSDEAKHRSFLVYSTDTTTSQQWAMPRVDLIDGTEPSILELVNNSGTPPLSSPLLAYGDGASIWQGDTTMVDMPALTGSLSPKRQLAGRSLSNISVQTCWMQETGIASATSAIPFFDPLLQACGMFANDDYQAGVSSSRTYRPSVTTTPKTATVSVFQDGVKASASGCVFNAEINLTAGQAAIVQFTGQGNYIPPVSAATPTSTLPIDTKTLVQSSVLNIKPKAVYPGAIPNVRPICRSMTFNTGNNIVERGDMNSNEGLKGVAIISRAPTLNLVVEADTNLPTSYVGGATTGPFFDSLKANDYHEVRVRHYTSSDAWTWFRFLYAQLVSVNISDDGGIRVYNLSYSLTGGQGSTSNGYEPPFLEGDGHLSYYISVRNYRTA